MHDSQPPVSAEGFSDLSTHLCILTPYDCWKLHLFQSPPFEKLVKNHKSPDLSTTHNFSTLLFFSLHFLTFPDKTSSRKTHHFREIPGFHRWNAREPRPRPGVALLGLLRPLRRPFGPSTGIHKIWQKDIDHLGIFQLHPRKLTCSLKRDYFSRECIFQPLIFRGHVSFQGGKLGVSFAKKNFQVFVGLCSRKKMSRIFQIDQDLFRLCDLRSMPTVHELGVMKKMTSTQTSCTIFVRQKSLKMTNSMCIKFDGQNLGDSEVNTPGVAWHCNSGNGTKGRNKQVISSRTSCPVSSVTQVSPWHVIVIVAVATFCPKLHTRCQDLHTKNTENDGTKLVV